MTTNNRAVLVAFSLASALLFASTASATVARAVGFDEKVEKAEAIVVGKCVKTRSAWDPEHKFILTYSTFTIDKSLKGTAPSEITLVTPGGSIGEIHQSAIGIPAFREGDEQVVFVKNTPAGPTVLFFDQGAYDVKPDDRGARVVAPIATGAVHVDTQRGVAVPSEEPRTLSDFEREVRSSMQRQAVAKMELMRAMKPPPSILSTMLRYKTLVGIALLGLALATWQFFRR